MSKDECRTCKYSEDIKGCASLHVSEARKLLLEGKAKEADQHLRSLEKHLKE
jgi:hypothetical protein